MVYQVQLKALFAIKCVGACQLAMFHFRLVLGLVVSLFGKSTVTYCPEGEDGETKEVDFTPPFKRVHIIKDLEKILGVTLPDATKFDTEGQHKI